MPWRSTKSGSHGVKMGSWGQIMEIPILCLVNTLEATFLVQSSRKLVKIIFSMKSRTSSNLGHVGLKTRSQAQMSLFSLYYRAPDKHGLDKLNFSSKISQEL